MRKLGTRSLIKDGRWLQKAWVFALAAAFAVLLSACGAKEKDSEAGNQEPQGYVYVPEYFTLEKEENSNMNTVVFQGERLYYSTYSWNEETGESIYQLCYREMGNMDEEVVLPVRFEGAEDC